MELSKFLSSMDLSEYERRAIIALSQKEHATATQIVKSAGIPQGRVYDVLFALRTKGIVDIVPTRPQRFLIRDVRSSLRQLLKKQQSDVEDRLKQLSSISIVQQQAGLHVPSSVSFYTSRVEHLQALIVLRNATRKEFVQMAPLFVGTSQSMSSLIMMADRGVRVRVITLRVNAENKKKIRQVKRHGVEVRTLSMEHMPSFAMRDWDEVLFGVNDYMQKEDRLYVLTKNRSMLLVFNDTFEKYWTIAKNTK